VTDDQSQRAPYPGLRAFRREETDLFFGREDCTNEMVDRLAATRFLAVLGSSGTGKSSLVRTGLLDALELGLMAKAGSRWKIVDFRPGGSPLKNLARRLLEVDSGDEKPRIASQDIDLLRAYLARGPRAVIEWCRSGRLPEGGNLLLLVDQFEELFRYQDYAGREEAEAFVALLIESAREANARIYVTITMRSEYLGACALIEGLSDAINAGMFLTPRMTREDCREAIVGPAEVCDIEIEPALVNRLLNDLANFAPWDEHDVSDQLDRLMRRADQLPLLQYTLNRMWQRAHDRAPGSRVKLTVEDYVAIEGLSGALNAHADQIFADLGKPRAQVAEWVFRALTAGSTIADAVRRPTRLDDLIAACGGDEAGVRAVVDAFRAPGVNFLMPEFDPHHPELALDTYIDISHESLIRQWKKLSDWLTAEGRAAQQWRRLVDRFGSGEMLRGRELANLIQWRTETKPNAAWAKRYGGDYPAVIGFLDKSQRAQNRKRAAAIASTVAAFVLVGGFGIHNKRLADQLADQKTKLQVQLVETKKERERAEKHKTEVVRLLERVVVDIVAPLTSSDRSATQITAPRRLMETRREQREGEERERDGGSGPITTEHDGQPSADRATAQPSEVQNPAVNAATRAAETARGLVNDNPEDNTFKRLLAMSLYLWGDALLQVSDPKGARDYVAQARQHYDESLGMLRAGLQALQDDSRSVEWKDDLASALFGRARAKIRQDDHAGARIDLEESISTWNDISDHIREEYQDRVLEQLHIQLGHLGDTYLTLKMRSEARTTFGQRLETARKRVGLKRDPARKDARRQEAQSRYEISIALDRVGQLLREDNDLDGSRKHFVEAVGYAREIYKREPDNQKWQETLVLSLNRIGDFDRSAGRQREALTAFEEAVGLQRKLAADPTAAAPQAALASLLNKIGDIRRRLQDYPAAITAHREELEIRRSIVRRATTNMLASRRTVSSALDYLGNTLRENRDVDGARKAFSEQLALDRAIARDFPSNASLADVGWSLNRLGDLDRDASNPNAAAKSYEESLGIYRKLLGREPNSLIRMRSLASTAGRLGMVHARNTQFADALKLHEEELGLRRKLFARASSGDTDSLRDLSLALDRVGNVMRDMGDLQGALKHFEEEVAMDRSFVARAPNNLTALGDLQWTLTKVSDFVRQRLSDRAAARKYMEELVTIDRRLVDRQPSNRDRHRRLKDDLTKLANLMLEMKDPTAARATYGEIFVATERWLGVARENFMNAANEDSRGELVRAYADAGWNGILAGRPSEAIPHIEAALSISPETPWNTVNLGHAYLFLGRHAEAIKLFNSVKNRPRGDEGKRTYADEIRDDFAIFRRLGLTQADLARVERELKL
jgi:tetratricopeptide (TPR) repeat protein